MFLDEALAEAGVGAKVRRIVQAIFAAAIVVVRLRQSDGTMTLSEPFDIVRVLQGDIFSPVAFIAGLDRIFRMHDLQNPGVAVGVGESTTIMSTFEYVYIFVGLGGFGRILTRLDVSFCTCHL